jgi:uncharacterized membrane protein
MVNRHLASRKSKLAVLAALGFASTVCVGLYIFRAIHTGGLDYFFLNWNLFLAWIPLLFAFAVYGLHTPKSILRYMVVALCAAVWLLFFPNAPYVLTDLLHLQPTGQIPIWFDLVLLLAYALTGLLLGFVSLYLMQDVVHRVLGQVAGWLFALAALCLGGFGVYVGRFMRWNSWDIFFDPRSLAVEIWHQFRHPIANYRAFAFSLFFALLSFSVYLVLFAFSRLAREGQRNP